MNRFAIALLAVMLPLAWAPPGAQATTSASQQPDSAAAAYRKPGAWATISTGSVDTIARPGLLRTADGVLHVAYRREVGTLASQLRVANLTPGGDVASSRDVLPTSWVTVDRSPMLVADHGGGLRAVFGGNRDTNPGFWSDGRMYTALGDRAGSSWTLPAQAMSISTSAYGSYGTAATTLADGTPVVAWPFNTRINWHVGTGPQADGGFDVGGCCTYDAAMVRDGSEVYVGWYGNGATVATNGVFVRRILPTLGPTLKAPGSSSVSLGKPVSLQQDRVALATRAGGGVFAAYCVGYPRCDQIRLWKVGTSTMVKVPQSTNAKKPALGVGPRGRLWLAWVTPSNTVRAVRTGVDGRRMGAVRDLGRPARSANIYALAIDGSPGRGDIVVNSGNGLSHTQALPGLTLKVTPKKWRRGVATKVRFTVTDAGVRVKGARVKIGKQKCRSRAVGVCTVKVSKTLRKGKHVVTATKAGYAPARVRTTVK